VVAKLKRLRELMEARQRIEQDVEANRFGIYAADPVGFIEKGCGGVLWSKQKQICLSVRDNRRTVVTSCHDVGKTYVAAGIAAWWLSSHKPGEAFVVSTAPTYAQVRALLWREINRIHKAAHLPGKVNQIEWFFGNELVGFGRAPKDATAFQGIHARYVLVLLDEACGVDKTIWNAADTLIANDDARILAIGNPDDPDTQFRHVSLPGSGWNHIAINAFESPNFTGEAVPDWLSPLLVSRTWVEEKRKDWGEDHPFWSSKVKGEFPDQAEGGLVPLRFITAALAQELPPTDPNELGVDVARSENGNATVIFHRRGAVARKIDKFRKRDLMHVVGRIVIAVRATGATRVKIDDAGLGGGVTDRLLEMQREDKLKRPDDPERLPSFVVVPVNVGAPCFGAKEKQRFKNLKAEINWAVRDMFVAGEIDLKDEETAGQAAVIKYETTSRGLILMQSKEDMIADKIPSPDDWDALVLAYANPNFKGRGYLDFMREQQAEMAKKAAAIAAGNLDGRLA